MTSRRRDRVGATVVALATVAGLWLGLTAPATSPVQPTAPVPGAAPLVPGPAQ